VLFDAERKFYRECGPFDAFVFQSEFEAGRRLETGGEGLQQNSTRLSIRFFSSCLLSQVSGLP